MHCIEPVAHRKFAVFHHSSFRKGHPATACLTLECVLALYPLVGCLATLGTDNTLDSTNLTEIGDTGIFVRESYTKLVEKHGFSGKGTAFGPHSRCILDKINIL